MAYLSGWDQDNRIEFSSNPSKVESQLSTFPGLLRICDASGNADDDLTAVFDELAITVTGDAFTRSDSNDAWFDNTYWAGSAGGLFGVWSTDHWETSGTFAYTIQLDPVGGWGALVTVIVWAARDVPAPLSAVTVMVFAPETLQVKGAV